MPTIMKGNKELTSQTVISNVLLTEQNIKQNEVVRQNFYNAYKECNPYNPAVTYVPNNKVIYMGGTYQNILTCTNIPPTYNLNNDNWICIASSGTGGDMYKTVYDTHNKQADIFDYVDNKTNTKLDIGNDYRPNILFNGDFKLWSAKTNFTFYNAAGGAGGYTADKWYIYVGAGTTATVSKVNNGLQVVTNGGTQILQFLNDDMEYLNKLVGKTVTISYKLDGVVQSYTQTFQKDPTDNRIIVINFNTGTHIFEWIKLEINEHVTPFIPRSYKEELLNCSDNVGYAPNLLINGDFQVWQRGENFDHTSTAGSFYSADRWCVFREAFLPGANVSRSDNGLVSANTADGKGTSIVQSIETSTVKKLRGKTVTLSVKMKNSITGAIYLNIWCRNDTEFIPGTGATSAIAQGQFSISTSFSTVSITGTVPVNAQGIEVEISRTLGGELTVEYAKLEINDHATPFILRSYAEELTMCQRYYQIITLRPTISMNQRVGSNYLIPGIYFPVVMRTTPTVTIKSGVGTIGKISENVNGTDVGTNCVVYFVNPTGFVYVKSDTALPDSAYGYNYFTIADAEI